LLFKDRRDAGRVLAARLSAFRGQRPVVIGLPRGGIPVAYEVARSLEAPLDVLVVRKLGCPWQSELGIGAIGEDGVRLLNAQLIAEAGVSTDELEAVTRRENEELERRIRRYRGDREPTPLVGRVAILVDDGLATGFTARAAVEVLRVRGAARVVLAVPVAPAEAVDELGHLVDDVICAHTPRRFMAIGEFYDDFSPTTDEEVTDLLETSRRQIEAAAREIGQGDLGRELEIVVDGGVVLRGVLAVPVRAIGMVIFAHGSGSSRLSPRNVAVSRVLNEGGLATLLFDLLTAEEAADRSNVFDIDLLARRLERVTRWASQQPEVAGLRVGYFGASTGAAAALSAAAILGTEIDAVVSRGGRPDLAGTRLRAVSAPTLLIVGSRDEIVLDLNRRAQRLLQCPSKLEIVAGATHLFEEPGALQRAAELARGWFATHLAASVVT
jgi:putative phosphoribosyl transferase